MAPRNDSISGITEEQASAAVWRVSVDDVKLRMRKMNNEEKKKYVMQQNTVLQLPKVWSHGEKV